MNDGAVTLEDGYQWFDQLAVLPIDAAAVRFFSNLGYLDEGKEVDIAACSSDRLVYSLLPEDKLLSDEDRRALGRIDKCAKIAAFYSSDYEEPSTDIDIYAVDLKDAGSMRSEAAYGIHAVFSKFNDNPSIVFFRSEKSVLLSFLQTTGEGSVAIYLSDWLTFDTVDIGQLERIHIGSCSLLSSIDLFDSLEFEAIRDYYKYPLSRYIAAYEVVFPSVNYSSMVDLSAFTREDRNEAIEAVLNTYATRYGDDYIDGSLKEIDQEDCVDLDDLEWEAQSLGLDDDEGFSSLDDVSAKKSLTSILTPPSDVMGDPIALLDWLEGNAGGSNGRDSEEVSALHAVPVGKAPPPVGSHLRHAGLGEGVVTCVNRSPHGEAGLYISAEFGGTSRSFAFPRAFESGVVELLG